MITRGGVAALASGVCIVALATAAHAQTQHFRIPAGGLRAAIDAYARQAGRQVIYKADEIDKVRSVGARGDMNADAALAKLLRGTGFSYRTDASGAIAIVLGEAHAGGVPPGAGPVKLPLEAEVDDEIVVTGIRASLERAIAIKRNSFGVVDAISAEDMGKFPDTNLAESLQRITGVSIDRTNGEGSLVTVRGFGPSYNLVTLNGRTLATSLVQVVGADQGGDDAVGTSRSFDFSNLASEGVRTLEVHKTGRAATPSGGVGATINVVTRRPLDNRASGLTGSIGAKAVYDASTNGCLDCGARVTPEITGVLSWKDPDDRFGVSLFGSYQKRNFTSVAAASNNWNIRKYSDFLAGPAGNIKPDGICPAGTTAVQPNCTIIKNAPTNPNQLTAVPDDSSYHYAEGSRARLNAQAVVQFRPTDSLTLTADALFAQDKQQEVRSSQSVWFAHPFDEVRFDGNPTVATATYLHETTNGVKDTNWEEQNRAQKSGLEDYGLNAKWDITDDFSLNLDGHISHATSKPNNPNGMSSTRLGTGAILVASHSVDYGGDIPTMDMTYSRTPALSDVGSTIARLSASSQSQRVKEVRADFGWDLGEGGRVDFGGNFRTSDTRQNLQNTYHPLGDWGLSNPGDIQQAAPGQLIQFCLVCRFDHYNPGGDPDANIAFRGDAAKVYKGLADFYEALGKNPQTSARTDNRVREEIWATYGQITWKGDLAGHAASLVAGARFERTTTTSTSLQAIPAFVNWHGGINISAQNVALVDKGHYSNLLPSMDFQVELARNLIARFSASRTIARPNYGSLFSATQIINTGITAVGSISTAATGNAHLKPLTSDNFDLSFEYYYKPDSFVSFGFFDKRVRNFIGNGQFNAPLFGLHDSTSGAAGTTSGDAKASLQANGQEVNAGNLFVMSALIQNLGSVSAAQAQFASHYTAGAGLDTAYQQLIERTLDVVAKPGDPLYNFQITHPVNTRDAEVYGFELAGQHFFGNTGFGVAASYTLVRGDVGYDNAADPGADQFALVGLSDTANITLIYDKKGLSARLAYNWRDKFLSDANRVPYHSPVYNKPFGQLDLNISYYVTPQLAVSFEGINLTRQSLRTYGRDIHQLWYAQELDRRFMLGARFKL